SSRAMAAAVPAVPSGPGSAYVSQIRRDSAKSGARATSSSPPWPLANTSGTPFSGAETSPSAEMRRRRPGRSVTRKPPSGSSATDQGCSRPEAMVSTSTWTAADGAGALSAAGASRFAGVSLAPHAGSVARSRGITKGRSIRAPRTNVWGSAILAHRLAGRPERCGAVVHSDLVAHVAYAAGVGGDVLGAVLHRPHGHVAGQGNHAVLDHQQDLAGVDVVVIGQAVDDVVANPLVGALVALRPAPAESARDMPALRIRPLALAVAALGEVPIPLQVPPVRIRLGGAVLAPAAVGHRGHAVVQGGVAGGGVVAGVGGGGAGVGGAAVGVIAMGHGGVSFLRFPHPRHLRVTTVSLRGSLRGGGGESGVALGSSTALLLVAKGHPTLPTATCAPFRRPPECRT